jgi:hypothetical protein
MADIYSKARKVVVWLGPESYNSAIALECFTKVSLRVEVDWMHYTMPPLSSTDESHWADSNTEHPFSDEDFLTAYDLLNRDWFKRLWTW